MLAAGGDANRANGIAGLTPLHGAAMLGDAPCVAALLDGGRGDPNRADDDGLTALTRAADRGCHACVELLLRAGGDPNRANLVGWGPLQAAARNGHFYCVALLLDAGGDPARTVMPGECALAYALRRGHRRLLPPFFRSQKRWCFRTLAGSVPRGDLNEDAWAHVDAVCAAGGWRGYARAHRDVALAVTAKCVGRALVDDLVGLVVDFWVPEGGF